MDRDRVKRLGATLRAGDAEMLSKVVQFCGGYEGAPFKDVQLATLAQARDRDRVERLLPVLRRLGEQEILWLCENGEGLTREKTERVRRNKRLR